VLAHEARQVTAEFRFVANQYQFQVRVLFERAMRRAHDDLGTEIAAHRIE
jgi:hypothetical protein